MMFMMALATICDFVCAAFSTAANSRENSATSEPMYVTH